MRRQSCDAVANAAECYRNANLCIELSLWPVLPDGNYDRGRT